MKQYIKDNMSIYNGDCMEGMAKYPDNYFDLVIVDPPYGINHSEIAGKQSNTKYGNAASAKKEYTIKDWDKSAPDNEYFTEIKRVSKNQIIWGANHFCESFESSCSGWVFWDKDNGSNNFSDGELAYTSFNKGLRKFKYTWNGMIQQDMKNKEERFHPTQKPVKLYSWLLQDYSSPEQKILDTHLGSASHAIAWHYFQKGSEFVGFELDEEYFNKSIKRIEQETAQMSLF